MFRILVAVCEDDWASTKDDAAQGLLRNFKKKNTIPDLMTLLDVLDHAVELSCCSQSEEFSGFFYRQASVFCEENQDDESGIL